MLTFSQFFTDQDMEKLISSSKSTLIDRFLITNKDQYLTLAQATLEYAVSVVFLGLSVFGSSRLFN